MRLRTENIHEYRLKCNTVAQITLDDDFNVPDTKDDIELIVKEWGNVQTDSVKVNKDKAAVDGELKFSLLRRTGIVPALRRRTLPRPAAAWPCRSGTDERRASI